LNLDLAPAGQAFVIFQIGTHVLAHTSLDHNLPVYVSAVAKMTDVHHHTLLFIG
jgi:hypothetical protein